MTFRSTVLVVCLAAAIIIILSDCSEAPVPSPLETDCFQRSYYMRCIACGVNSLNVTCSAGKKINVVSALYGRFQPYLEVCQKHGSPWKEDLNCNGSQLVTKIMSRCQDKPRCFIPSNPHEIIGEFKDPCVGTEKYIDINLTCSISNETLKYLNPAGAQGLGNLENQIEDVSRTHPETNGTSYTYGDTQLHIVVTNIDKKTYNASIQLGSSHINFTLQTNNVNRIVAAVFAYNTNTTKTAQVRWADAGSLGTTRYQVIENITYIVIVGWDANVFLRSSNHSEGNDQLPGNTTFVVSPSSPESMCKKIEEEKKNTSYLLIKKLKPICLFVHKVSWRYSDVGCVTSIDEKTRNVICKCNHLTIFTVLLAVETIAIPSGVKIISYATEAASIAFLVATIVILIIHRQVDDRIPIQINLSVALLLFHAVNISHDIAVLHKSPCMVFTVTLHYLLLCVGMWFLVEGVRLVMATSFPYTFEAQDPDIRFKIFMVVGWIVPAFLVGTAASVGFSHDIYMKQQPFYTQCNNFLNQSLPIPKYDRCWLAPGTSIFYASVFAPLALVLLINFVIILKTTHVMFKLKKMQNREGHRGADYALRAAKSFFLLLLMLGGTWSLAFFTGIGNEISNEVFMYINSVVNGSQGIVVFLLYCVMNHVIRQEILPCKSQANAVPEQQQNMTNTDASHQR